MKTANAKRLAMHALFWVVSLGFFWLLFSRQSNNKFNTAIFIAILSPIVVFTTYFFNYRLIPKFLIKGKYFKFIWYGIITATLAVWLVSLGGILIWARLAEFEMGRINRNTIDVPMLIAALFFVVLIGVSSKLIRMNFQVQKEKDLAEKEKLMLDNQLKITELKLLKEQLNPHFLFNTLNNLYGLALEKSDKAPDLVLRLSNILDYMLYQTNETFVPLSQEIQLIENYIAIEQHRFEGRYPIRFIAEGNFDNTLIAPLLFLPLVENCFKHGIRKAISNSYIHIQIRRESDSILFDSENSYENGLSHAGGIGLSNLERRLEMLYKNAYDFKIDHSGGIFKASLIIKTGNEKV